MYADAVDDPVRPRRIDVPLNHHFLDRYRAFDSCDDGGKLKQQSVAHRLDDAPAPARHERLRCFTMLPHRPRRPDLVLAHQAGIADDVDRHDRSEFAGFGHCAPQTGLP